MKKRQDEEQKTILFNLRMSESEKKALEAKAAEVNMSLSSYVRLELNTPAVPSWLTIPLGRIAREYGLHHGYEVMVLVAMEYIAKREARRAGGGGRESDTSDLDVIFKESSRMPEMNEDLTEFSEGFHKLFESRYYDYLFKEIDAYAVKHGCAAKPSEDLKAVKPEREALKKLPSKKSATGKHK